ITEGKYRVVGNPNLNEIRMFAVGVVNTDTSLAGRLSEVNGRIWLDELRVTDVRRDVGTAGRITTNGTIADLISYNFGYSSKDPYFRSISAATRGGSSNNLGSGQTETSSNVGVTFNLHKLLPRSWGANLPISYNERSSTKTPLLRTNTDIVLPEAIRELEKSTNNSRSISISGVKFNHKGRNPLFSLFLNRLEGTSFSYGRTKSHDVRTPYRLGENLSFQSGFDFGMKHPPSVPIFFWTKYIPIARKTSNSKLYLYPSTWKVKGNFQRSLTIQDNANNQRLTTVSRLFNASLDLNYKIFDNLTFGYRYTTDRDLTDLDLVRLQLRDPKLGLETRYQQSSTGSYDPKLLDFLTAAFSYRAGYTEDYDRTYEAYRSSLTESHSVNGVFDHNKLLGAGGSSERRFRGRANIRGGGAKQDEGQGGKFYDTPLALLRRLVGWIQPFSYKYETSFKNSLPGIQERPYWKYRFGFTREPNITKFADQNRSPLSTESQNYSLSSGFVLMGGIKTDVAFRRTISTDLITQGVRYENTSTSWPDLSIRIQPFRTLPLIKPVINKLIDIFSPRTGYTRQTREKFNLDGSFLTETSTSISHSPLISLTLKLHRSLQLTGAYTLLKENSFRYNQTNGDFTSETKTLKKTIAASTKYSFSAPGGIGFPLLGRLKFKSTMSIEVNVKVNSDLSETANKGKDFVANSDKSDISISPRISYQFSSKIKGGITGRWQDSVDNRREITNHIRELQIWTEITF
ncbi:MAG: hypothetical protein P1R58_05805, partial [bacterium]|nr:hypothetical protein [bacterium]